MPAWLFLILLHMALSYKSKCSLHLILGQHLVPIWDINCGSERSGAIELERFGRQEHVGKRKVWEGGPSQQDRTWAGGQGGPASRGGQG